MPAIAFPKIPQVATGQLVSAATLNSYGAGLNYLLGESHGGAALERSSQTLVCSQTTATTLWTYYQYHAANTFYYRWRVYQTSGGNTWTMTIYFVDGLGVEHTVPALQFSGSGSAAWVEYAGTVDLSALGLAVGNLYEIRLKASTSSAAAPASFVFWRMGERNEVASVWVTPPVFTAGLSNSAHFNALRDDLINLQSRMISPVHALYSYGPGEYGSANPAWTTVAPHGAFIYRYRPNALRVALQWRTGTETEWQWRLVSEYDGTVVYTDPTTYGGIGETYQWIDTGALDVSSLGLTVGNDYRFYLQCRVHPRAGDPGWEAGGQMMYLRHIILTRVSSGTPGAGWVVPPRWAEGDTNMTPTRLNALSADLALFYTGGAECLWGETPAIPWFSGAAFSNFAGTHRKRFLIYWPATGLSPQLYYGAAFGQVYSLSSTAGWNSLDTAEIGLPWGGLYFVDNALVAFECDHRIS